ncbi:MAG TPA: molybdate ABC transporter substrate-binding protein [Steroidobacteraceae bacterium]|nr:molybdate ABC transporter substrate-binding protein [Steroidobacteraceae bacterium]
MPIRLRHWLAAVLCNCSALAHAADPAAEQPPITVFAAASLNDALEQVAAPIQAQGVVLKLSFASSSTLARQIENGATADIFISADEEWMAYLDERKLVAKDTWVRPIGNDLVMVAPKDEAPSISLDPKFDIAGLLGDKRLAVGDPAHVPAGRYARQSLEHYGWWQAVEPHLARAENVRAALALVERGEVPLGIVYATDARASRAVRVVVVFPAASHEPILYSFAAVAGRDNAQVRSILQQITTGNAREIYRKNGFQVK